MGTPMPSKPLPFLRHDEAILSNGQDGLAYSGKDEEYATELWLDDPSAFFLHPEGPLSDTTPDEWRAKEVERKKREREAQLQNPYANTYQQMMGLGLQGNSLHLQLLQAQQQSLMSGAYQNHLYRQQSLLSEILESSWRLGRST